jgi:PTS system galactitol-specific IIC component
VKVVQDFLSKISEIQSYVLVPLAILIFSLIARMRFGKAFKSAMMVGIGLVGLFAIVSLLAASVVPALQGFVKSTGVNLPMPDLGNSTLLASVYSMKLFIWLIPLGAAVNFLMLKFKLTKTLDVDILDYWVWGITSLVINVVTHNVILSLVGFIINEAIILWLADLTAPKIQKYYDLQGISIPHGNAIFWFPVAVVVNWVIDRIPGLNKLEANPETIKRRFGILGDPITIGAVIGFLLGILGRLSIASSLALGVIMAAAMILFPRVAGVLMEGLVPISEAIREFLKSRFKREVYIGLDAAILIGYPENIATGVLLVPIILLLAFILPGNRVLPMIDLAVAGPFFISFCMPFFKKANIFRGLITGVVIFIIALYAATALGPYYSAAAVESGAAVNMGIPEGTIWSSVGAGSQLISLIWAKALALFGLIP